MTRALLLCTLALAAPSAVAAQSDAAAAADAAAEADVAAVVNRLFDGMRAADSAMVRSVFLADARLVTAGSRDGEPFVRVSGADGFVRAVGGAEPGAWDERLHGMDIRVDDNLATAWTPYSFIHEGEFSHCGVNAFQLARTADGWKIIHIADTRRGEDCGGEAGDDGADASRVDGADRAAPRSDRDGPRVRPGGWRTAP